jgi:hypothetical protein
MDVERGRACSGEYIRLGGQAECGQELLGTSDGPALPAQCAVIDATRKAKTERPCWLQLASVVQIRSNQR